MTDLVVFDFDYSLLEQENTDYIIFEELAPDIFAKISELYKQYLSEKKGWNNLMHDLVVKLFERRITREQIVQVFDDTPITPSMAAAVRLLHSKKADIRIVSDANTVYIDTVLRSSKMTKMFTEIRTNPASFDDRGCLVIGPYEKSPPQCPNGCPPNLCKGKEMADIFSKGTYRRAVYVGDGGGDFCACTKLRAGDFALVRAGNPLERLVKAKSHLVKAEVVVWESGNDVLKFFKGFCAKE